MDSNRDIVMRVREALDYQAAAQAGRNPNERRPLADVLPERIVGELLPMLREAYLLMILIAEQWQQKPFQVALSRAIETNTLLAGLPASVYVRFGEFMLAHMEFLDTPRVDGTTAKDVLFGDYIPMTDAEWAALNAPALAQPIVPPVEPEPAP